MNSRRLHRGHRQRLQQAGNLRVLGAKGSTSTSVSEYESNLTSGTEGTGWNLTRGNCNLNFSEDIQTRVSTLPDEEVRGSYDRRKESVGTITDILDSFIAQSHRPSAPRTCETSLAKHRDRHRHEAVMSPPPNVVQGCFQEAPSRCHVGATPHAAQDIAHSCPNAKVERHAQMPDQTTCSSLQLGKLGVT